MNFVEIYIKIESITESEKVSDTNNMITITISLTNIERVKIEEWDKVREHGNKAVNVKIESSSYIFFMQCFILLISIR